jgi:two-component system cell cycle response regulator CpdR
MIDNQRANAMIRVLLAEDDEPMRTFLARALSRAGFDVVAVADGRAALGELDLGVYDLLLSGIILPGIGGVELARHCAKVCPETRIVLITGFAAVSLEASREAPRATILSAPFHLRSLVGEVERLFG